MDDYQIKTPEQVDIGYAIAGLGTRCMALAIDMFIQAVALTGIIILLISNGLWLEAFGGWYMALLIIVIALIVGGYYIFFEWLMKGKTPGKALLRIRVMRLDGRAADAAGIVVRNLLRLIDFLPFLYSAGMITMFINKDSRRLGDLAAGTVVVKVDSKVSLNSILAAQNIPKNAGNTSSEGFSTAINSPLLTNEEYAVIREFLARRKHMTMKAREKLAAEFAAPLFERAVIPQSEQHDPELFLEKVLRDTL